MPILEPEELDSLMSNIRREQGGPGAVYAPLDLTNPERNVPEPMPRLEAVSRTIANQFGILLSAITSTTVEPRFQGLSRGRFRDLIRESEGGVLGVIELGKGERPALALVPGTLAEGLIGATLGAKDSLTGNFDASSLTIVEIAVLKRVLAFLERPIAAGFADILPLEPRVTHVTGDPRLAASFRDDDVAIVIPFTLNGDIQGDFRLALPYATLDEARDKLVLPRRAPPSHVRWGALARELVDVEMQVVVELGRGHVSCLEAERLAEGDLLLLDSTEAAPLRATVGGLDKFEVRPEVRGSRIVAVVESVLTPAAEVQGGRTTSSEAGAGDQRPRPTLSTGRTAGPG